MRTKTLLLTAALSAAGLASSMAQVYSVNAVGYVNVSIPGNNKLAILANPLIGTNDAIGTVIPTAPDGTTIYRFNPAAQNYRDSLLYIDGFGWLPGGDDPNPKLPVGEGFWAQNPGANATLTFVGEVAQGAASNGTQIQGGNKLSLLGSKVPQSARLGNPTTPGTLQYNAADGDTVYQFDTVTQNYKDSSLYIDGFGWLNNSDPSVDGPLIDVGTGFWVQSPGVTRNWDRNFTVN
jgi:hypothetical protein